MKKTFALAAFALAAFTSSAFATGSGARIELVCCDLAGTTVDYGSTTPAVGFREIFGRHKLSVTEAELAGPMGKKKADHIREVLAIPGITAQWKALHGGAAPAEPDVAALTAEFIALDREIIPKTSSPITGVPEALSSLKTDGIKIAYTSGYPRVLMDLCLKNLKDGGAPQGFSVSADEVPAGRPAPYMLHRCMVETKLTDVRRCIAIGDTQSDIEAAKNAGFIAVGVAKSGMLVGLTEAQQHALRSGELDKRVAAAREKLFGYGADFVIDDTSKLPALIAEIESGKAVASKR